MSKLKDRLRQGEIAYFSEGGPVYSGPTLVEALAYKELDAKDAIIAELAGLLREADMAVIWESNGFNRNFQDRVEAALSKASQD